MTFKTDIKFGSWNLKENLGINFDRDCCHLYDWQTEELQIFSVRYYSDRKQRICQRIIPFVLHQDKLELSS